MTYNPLAPRTPRQLRRQARYAVGASYGPLFAQLNKRESGNQAAIRDYTQRLVQQLGPVANQVGGYYQQAENRQQDVTNQLANRLGSVGGQEAAALQTKLAQAGLPADQAQRISAIGSGAANTGAALGSANLSSLLASGAAQQAYAGKLPGIAALGGLQFARQNLGQMEQQREGLQARQSGAIQSELSQLQNLEFQKAAANLGFAGTQAKIGADVAKTQAGINYKVRQGRKPDPSLSKAYGHIVDSSGRTIPGSGGKAIPVAKSPSAANAPAKAAAKRKAAFYTTRQKTFTTARSFYGSGPSGGGGGGNPLIPTTGGGGKHVPAEQAYNKLWAQYGTQLVNQYGYKRSPVDAMIRKALRAAGYQLPSKAEKQAAAAGAAGATQAVGQLGF